MPKLLKRALAALAILAIALPVAGWLLVRDEVSRFRAMAARDTRPVAPMLAHAIEAAEGPFPSARPGISFSSLRWPLPRRNVVWCAPTLPFQLVRWVAPQRRALWSNIETALATVVVSRTFTPDELLRIYAHEVYLGRDGSRAIHGVEAASRFYFGKDAHALTAAEAATIAAMIRSPHAFSPVAFPERAAARRNRVLERMHSLGFLSEDELRAARRPT